MKLSIYFCLIIFALISLSTLLSLGRTDLFFKQLIFFIFGFGIFVLLQFLPPQIFVEKNFIRVLIGFSIFLLILLLIVNFHSQNRSWFRLGIVNFQPVEFAKVVFYLWLSGILSYHLSSVNFFNSFFKTLLPACVYFFLVILQPDLGSAFTFVIIWFLIIFPFLNWRNRTLIIFGFVILFLIGWFFFLEPYQKARLIVLFRPEIDPLGKAYNLWQTKITVGSGGLWGKGYGKGTQARLGFLPASATDFFLASFTEERGFVGWLLVSLNFLVFVLALVRLIQRIPFLQGQLFGYLFLINIVLLTIISQGVNLGLFPIIGLPTPFLSAGGSHLLRDFISLGILFSFAKNKI